MSEPEIARRCQSCGASIRDLAFFCPQCGKSLKTTGELTKPAPDNHKPSMAVATAPLNEPPKPKGQLDDERSTDKNAKKSKLENPMGQKLKSQEPASKNPAGRAKGTPGSHTFAEARGQVQRATGLARNVRGDVIQRGQKLREMSGVVLDEASYDPSLRFVLVAALLFLLFIVIVLLNRFIV